MRTVQDFIGDRIWESMWDSLLGARYWRTISQRRYRWNRFLKIFLAITSSSTVASWGLWNETKIVWQIFGGVSAVISVTLPILNLEKEIQMMSTLSVKWSQIHNQYDILWVDYETGRELDEIIRDYKNIKEKEPLDLESPGLPDRKKRLWRRCQDEIEASYGV